MDGHNDLSDQSIFQEAQELMGDSVPNRFGTPTTDIPIQPIEPTDYQLLSFSSTDGHDSQNLDSQFQQEGMVFHVSGDEEDLGEILVDEFQYAQDIMDESIPNRFGTPTPGSVALQNNEILHISDAQPRAPENAMTGGVFNWRCCAPNQSFDTYIQRTPSPDIFADCYDMGDNEDPQIQRGPSPNNFEDCNVIILSEEIEERINIPKRLTRQTTSQFGAGPSRKVVKAPPPPPPPRNVDRFKNVTAGDLEYLGRFTVTNTSTKFKRMNQDVIKLLPLELTFTNMDKIPKDTTLDKHVAKVFDIFIRKTIKEANGDLKKTKYWLNLRHPGFKNADGYWVIHQTYEIADGHYLINAIADVMQSNKEVSLDETMTLTMKIFERDPKAMPGRGRAMPPESLGAKMLKNFGIKWGLVTGESHCLAKALVIGKLWSDYVNEEDPEKKKALNNQYTCLTRNDKKESGRVKRQLTVAKKLLEDAGMDPERGEHNLEDFDRLADYLADYRIRLWTVKGDTAVPTIDRNKNTTGKGSIALFYHENHYEVFKPKVTTFEAKICNKCRKFMNKEHHRVCTAVCKRCGGLEKCDGEKNNGLVIYCKDCNIDFYSKKCYDAHLKKRSKKAFPYCKKFVKCQECLKIHERDEYTKQKHECYATQYCHVCRRLRKFGHECTHPIPTIETRNKKLKNQTTWTMVVYDFESIVTQKDEDEGDTTEGVAHKVNLVCYRLICDKCLGEKDCRQCGPIRNFSYKDKEAGTVVDRFVEFLISDPRLKNAYIVAHNGGKYDHIFLLTAMTKKVTAPPEFISTGNKILNATVTVASGNVLTFRDSLAFMPMALSDMPGAFDLSVQDKGQFPYKFNHPINYGRKLTTLPPIEEYEPQYMSEKKRTKFLEWHKKNEKTEFIFDEEILSYCENDVEILTAAVCKYIKLCQEMFNGWNPFIQACTLASYNMFVLKHEHLEEGVVGYIPENGFAVRNNSEYALKYIRWLELNNPQMDLQHTLKGGEKMIHAGDRTCYVDAFDKNTKEIYEINGCLWHGCKHCFPARDAPCPRKPDFTMQELYDDTMARQEALEEAGYTVHAIWECEIKSELKKNEEMSKFFKSCRYAHQLRPREAMYGGRTQPFQSIATADYLSTLEYYDYCSVYPWVNIKGTVYPKGQPIRFTEKFESVTLKNLKYKGLIFCDILPPEYLLIPVLPYRFDGKLIFPLCRMCVECKKNEKCTHKLASERCLTGVWCTDELQLALDQGYKILKYHEVWHWPEEKWFRGGFFASFMKPLLKQKHEASGWPRPNMSDDEKKAHVDAIKLNDDVEIDPSKVEKNPALRSLAKLFLNSTWGKFAQKPGKMETKIIKTCDHVAIGKFFDEPGFEPKRFDEWDEDHVLVARQPIQSAVETGSFTNVVYGALTTSAARIRLYTALDRIGADRLIYCDTDSVIFRQDRGTDLLGDLKGESLGMMTNEISSGNELVEVVTVAPKVYGMKTKNTETGEENFYVKAKGITLNSETAKEVNYHAFKRMMTKYIEEGEAEPLNAQRTVFKRGRLLLDDITTHCQAKRLKPVTDKGYFTGEGRFEPFGFLENNNTITDDYNL